MSKYREGDKFEIEIEKVLVDDMLDSVYKIKGFKTLVFDDCGIGKLEKIHENAHSFKVGEVVNVDMANGEVESGIITQLQKDNALVIREDGRTIIAPYEDISFTGRYTGLTDWLKDNIQDNTVLNDEIPF